MRRSDYFALCMSQSLPWLRRCADHPSRCMRPCHVALVRLAIRKKQASKA